MHFESLFLYVGSIFVVVFTVLLVTLRNVRRRTAVGSEGVPTNATIVALEDDVATNYGATSSFYITRLRVRFTTATGEVVEGVTPTGNSLARLRYKPGQAVAVRYNPLNPRHFTVDAFDSTNHTIMRVIFWFVAGGILVLGLLVALFFSFIPH